MVITDNILVLTAGIGLMMAASYLFGESKRFFSRAIVPVQLTFEI